MLKFCNLDVLEYQAVHLSEARDYDADQRITTDVEKLCRDLAGLVTGMVKPLVDIVWYVPD